MAWYARKTTGELAGPGGSRQDRGFIAHETFTTPEATDTDECLTATLLTSAAQVLTADDLDAQPDVPRCLSITGGQSDQDGDVVIVGLDSCGQSITETLTTNGTTTVHGTKAFASITQVTLPAYTTDGAENMIIGVNDKLGLEQCLSLNTVLATYVDGTLESTAPTVTLDASDVSKNTIDCNTAMDGAKDVDVFYIA